MVFELIMRVTALDNAESLDLKQILPLPFPGAEEIMPTCSACKG